MPMDSPGTPNKNSSATAERPRVSAEEAKILRANFRAALMRFNTPQQHQIMRGLIKKKPAESVTWTDIRTEIDIQTKVKKIIGMIKKGKAFGRLDEIRELGTVDLGDFGIKDHEMTIKKEVLELLQAGRLEDAMEIVNVFGGYFDFAPVIKEVYPGYVKTGENDTAGD
jgi:hypothetical protein